MTRHRGSSYPIRMPGLLGKFACKRKVADMLFSRRRHWQDLPDMFHTRRCSIYEVQMGRFFDGQTQRSIFCSSVREVIGVTWTFPSSALWRGTDMTMLYCRLFDELDKEYPGLIKSFEASRPCVSPAFIIGSIIWTLSAGLLMPRQFRRGLENDGSD